MATRGRDPTYLLARYLYRDTLGTWRDLSPALLRVREYFLTLEAGERQVLSVPDRKFSVLHPTVGQS